MEFHICISTGGIIRKNTGGAKLTADGVNTIFSLFMHSYRNSKRCFRTIQQCPGGNNVTSPAEKKTIPKNGINRTINMKIGKRVKAKNSQNYWRTLWMISLKSSSQNWRNICNTYHERYSMGYTESSHHLQLPNTSAHTQYKKKIGKGRGPMGNKK